MSKVLNIRCTTIRTRIFGDYKNEAGSSVIVNVTYKGKSTDLKVVCTTEALAQYKVKCVFYAYKTIVRSPNHSVVR